VGDAGWDPQLSSKKAMGSGYWHAWGPFTVGMLSGDVERFDSRFHVVPVIGAPGPFSVLLKKGCALFVNNYHG
jgi:hypothetical protein